LCQGKRAQQVKKRTLFARHAFGIVPCGCSASGCTWPSIAQNACCWDYSVHVPMAIHGGDSEASFGESNDLQTDAEPSEGEAEGIGHQNKAVSSTEAPGSSLVDGRARQEERLELTHARQETELTLPCTEMLPPEGLVVDEAIESRAHNNDEGLSDASSDSSARRWRRRSPSPDNQARSAPHRPQLIVGPVRVPVRPVRPVSVARIPPWRQQVLAKTPSIPLQRFPVPRLHISRMPLVRSPPWRRCEPVVAHTPVGAHPKAVPCGVLIRPIVPRLPVRSQRLVGPIITRPSLLNVTSRPPSTPVGRLQPAGRPKGKATQPIKPLIAAKPKAEPAAIQPAALAAAAKAVEACAENFRAIGNWFLKRKAGQAEVQATKNSSGGESSANADDRPPLQNPRCLLEAVPHLAAALQGIAAPASVVTDSEVHGQASIPASSSKDEHLKAHQMTRAKDFPGATAKRGTTKPGLRKVILQANLQHRTDQKRNASSATKESKAEPVSADRCARKALGNPSQHVASRHRRSESDSSGKRINRKKLQVGGNKSPDVSTKAARRGIKRRGADEGGNVKQSVKNRSQSPEHKRKKRRQEVSTSSERPSRHLQKRQLSSSEPAQKRRSVSSNSMRTKGTHKTTARSESSDTPKDSSTKKKKLESAKSCDGCRHISGRFRKNKKKALPSRSSPSCKRVKKKRGHLPHLHRCLTGDLKCCPKPCSRCQRSAKTPNCLTRMKLANLANV